MSKIQKLLDGKDQEIDFEKIIKKYPWIVKKNQKCILSPDSDGLLCGLFMSHKLNWKIKGFYDGKILIIEKGLSAEDCIFLDIEIFRKRIRSFGHHMLLYNNNEIPDNWENFNNCIQPNNIRNYDGLHNFRLKYPLATIHFLLCLVNQKYNVKLSKDAIAPLFFTDGTYNVLFRYPENVLNWLNFLRSSEEKNPLKKIFLSDRFSVYKIMLEMDDFFRKRDEISISKERGDRLRISGRDGKPFNLIKKYGTYKLKEEAVNRINQFIDILSEFTGWKYKKENWLWNNFNLFNFTKKDFKSINKRVNGTNFKEMIKKNPLSWAMTSRQNIEYTLEKPDKVF